MNMKVGMRRIAVSMFITGLFFALAFFAFTDPFAGFTVVGDGQVAFVFFLVVSPVFLMIVGINVGKLKSYLILGFPIYAGLLSGCLFYSITLESGAMPVAVTAVFSSGVGVVIGYLTGHKEGVK